QRGRKDHKTLFFALFGGFRGHSSAWLPPDHHDFGSFNQCEGSDSLSQPELLTRVARNDRSQMLPSDIQRHLGEQSLKFHLGHHPEQLVTSTNRLEPCGLSGPRTSDPAESLHFGSRYAMMTAGSFDRV